MKVDSYFYARYRAIVTYTQEFDPYHGEYTRVQFQRATYLACAVRDARRAVTAADRGDLERAIVLADRSMRMARYAEPAYGEQDWNNGPQDRSEVMARVMRAKEYVRAAADAAR